MVASWRSDDGSCERRRENKKKGADCRRSAHQKNRWEDGATAEGDDGEVPMAKGGFGQPGLK